MLRQTEIRGNALHVTKSYRTAIIRWAALLVCAGAALVATGCASPASITSAWPIATSERKVPQPPVTPRWPLTGLNAPSQSAIHRRVISVKIENSPEARPQTGLNEADVVYESVTEGGITRFNTLWQSNLPKVVGPVRSARLSDLWIVPQYNALLFFSGSSKSVNAYVKSAKLPDLSQDAGVTQGYFRSSAQAAPHNLFLQLLKGYQIARSRGYSVTTNLAGFRFARTPANPGEKVKSVYVPLSPQSPAKWVWDSRTHTFKRFNNGRPHRDALTGSQVAARNVVVMWARYTPASHDVVGSTTYNIALGGTGRAMVFRDGRAIAGNWFADKSGPPTFEDTQGDVIKLAPGNTWIEVVPLSVNITMR